MGAELVLFLRQHKLYSILSFKRRACNMRGSPTRAAFGFCLLQELRLTTEQKFNVGIRDAPQILRNEIQNLLGTGNYKHIDHSHKIYLDEYIVDNPDFMARTVEPIMPVNPLWRRETTNGGKQEIGLLIETQVIGCLPNMHHFGRMWWPLTSAHVSRNLNVRLRSQKGSLIVRFKVVLGIQSLNHIRISDERLRLSLHNPFMYLCPSICTRRTLGSHLV